MTDSMGSAEFRSTDRERMSTLRHSAALTDDELFCVFLRFLWQMSDGV